MPARDSQRDKVYRAEDVVEKMLTRGGVVEVAGSRLTLPSELRFGDVAAAHRYVAALRTRPDVIAALGPSDPVQVVAGRAEIRAAYSAGVITLPRVASTRPDARSGWAMREFTLLHEFAHHLTHRDHPSVAAHGPEFTATMLTLVGVVLGPEVALLLRITYGDNDVR